MSIFSPQFPSQPTPAGATVATTQFPTELAPFIKDILEKAKAQQSDASYQAYTGPQLAQFTDKETAAMNAIVNQATGLAGTDVAQASPYFQGAKTAVEGLGQQFTGDTAQQYMNPYQQAVVDQAKAKAVEDYESKIAPGIAAQAVASQPFGGSRQAIAEGMARQDLTDKLTEIQERGSADAFNQGRAAFEAQKARELQQGQQFAQLGQTIPQQALRDLAIQQQIGEQERQQEQRGLDLAKSQFMEEREFPTRALQEYSAVVRGFPFQPSTYTAQTQYQPTPSIGSQLLQLGGAGLGAYTQFGGQLPKLFGATGGGIADIIHNQEGTNEQNTGLTEESALTTTFENNKRGFDIVNGERVPISSEEFHNRYGIGGTQRTNIESIIAPEFLPTEPAPFRIQMQMEESAQGAPMGGPLPSQEEMQQQFLNEQLQNRPAFYNQGGLVTVYNQAGENDQNVEEDSNLINETYTMSEVPEISGTNIIPDISYTEPSALDIQESAAFLKGIPGLDTAVKSSLDKLTENKSIYDAKAYKEAIDPNKGLLKTTTLAQKKLEEQSDPTSKYSLDKEEKDKRAAQITFGQGITKAALNIDPNASFVQQLSGLIGGIGNAKGQSTKEYDALTEENIKNQINAASGAVELNTNYLNTLNQIEENVIKADAAEQNKHLTLVNSQIDNLKTYNMLTGDIYKHKGNLELKLIDQKLARAQTQLDRDELKVKRAEVINSIKAANVKSALESIQTNTDKNYKLGSLELEGRKILLDYNATISALDKDKILDADDGKKIMQITLNSFGYRYNDENQLVGEGGSAIENPRDLAAFNAALSYAIGEAGVLKASGKAVLDSELLNNIQSFQENRATGLSPILRAAIPMNTAVKTKLTEEYNKFVGTRNEFNAYIIGQLSNQDGTYNPTNTLGIELKNMAADQWQQLSKAIQSGQRVIPRNTRNK